MKLCPCKPYLSIELELGAVGAQGEKQEVSSASELKLAVGRWRL